MGQMLVLRPDKDLNYLKRNLHEKKEHYEITLLQSLSSLASILVVMG